MKTRRKDSFGPFGVASAGADEDADAAKAAKGLSRKATAKRVQQREWKSFIAKTSLRRLDARGWARRCADLPGSRGNGGSGCAGGALVGRRGNRDAEASLRVVGLHVAKRDGEGIGRIGRLRSFGHGQKRTDHKLNLAFVGMAVAGNAGFDFARRVAVHGEAVLFSSEEHDAADFSKAQGGAHVEGAEDAFDRHHIWMKFLHELAERRVDFAESSAGGLLSVGRRSAQRTVVNGAATPAIRLDDAVTGRAGRGWIKT